MIYYRYQYPSTLQGLTTTAHQDGSFYYIVLLIKKIQYFPKLKVLNSAFYAEKS
nr:MAG TPA: hypothetical protein [Caudoviricetes sp.]